MTALTINAAFKKAASDRQIGSADVRKILVAARDGGTIDEGEKRLLRNWAAGSDDFFTTSARSALVQVVGEWKDLVWKPRVPVAPMRSELLTPEGVRIQSFPGSESELAHAQELVRQLAQSPAFAGLLQKTTIVITPPGKGVEAIPGTDAPPDIEGIALVDGLLGTSTPHAVVIRHDSLTRWNMGLGHELLHVFSHETPFAAGKIFDVWNRTYGPNPEKWGYLTPDHLFVFLGQYYLAGYGDEVNRVAPEVYRLCQELLGNARYSSRTTGRDEARALITQIVDAYRA